MKRKKVWSMTSLDPPQFQFLERTGGEVEEAMQYATAVPHPEPYIENRMGPSNVLYYHTEKKLQFFLLMCILIAMCH